MTTTDIVAVVVAALVTALVCVAFVARTRHEPATSRSAVALAVAAGLSAVVVVLVVHLVPLAGQGDPAGTLGRLVTTALETLVRPVTIAVAAAAAGVGLVVGLLRARRSRGPAA